MVPPNTHSLPLSLSLVRLLKLCLSFSYRNLINIVHIGPSVRSMHEIGSNTTRPWRPWFGPRKRNRSVNRSVIDDNMLSHSPPCVHVPELSALPASSSITICSFRRQHSHRRPQDRPKPAPGRMASDSNNLIKSEARNESHKGREIRRVARSLGLWFHHGTEVEPCASNSQDHTSHIPGHSVCVRVVYVHSQLRPLSGPPQGMEIVCVFRSFPYVFVDS